MRPWLTAFTAFTLAVLLSAFNGCFTEVGNAQDERLVVAHFQVDYSPTAKPLPKTSSAQGTATYPTTILDTNSVYLKQFYLDVREAEYQYFDSATNTPSEFHLWRDDSATLPVDFTGLDASSSLPSQKVGLKSPLSLSLDCLIPKNTGLKPDTVNINAFKDRGYIVGTCPVHGKPTPFVFALPAAPGVAMVYSKQTLQGWLVGNTYQCQFSFFATVWMANSGVDSAATIHDKIGNAFILLDSLHNPVIYNTLSTRFYQSFNTSQVHLGDLN